jgi:tetratricopeptide (TPR) repeat protein
MNKAEVLLCRATSALMLLSLVLLVCSACGPSPEPKPAPKAAAPARPATTDANTERAPTTKPTAASEQPAAPAASAAPVHDAATEIAPEARELFNQATALLATDPGKAIALFEQAAARSPAYRDARYNAAALQQAMGKVDDAIAAYERIVRATPADSGVAVNLAQLLREQGKLAAAEQVLANAAAARPDALDIRNARIEIQIDQGALPEAERAALDILRVDEKNVGAMLNLARLYYRQKKYELSNLAITNVLGIDPANAGAYSIKGFVKLAQKDKNEAKAAFEKASTLMPESPYLHFNAASLLRVNGDIDGAARHMSEVIRLRPGNPTFQLEQANLLRAQKKYKEALDAYKKVLASAPDMLDAVYNLGILYLDDELPDLDLIDRYKTATAYLQDYLARAKPEAALQKSIGDFLAFAGKEITKEEKRREQQKKREERKKKEDEKKKAQPAAAASDGNSDSATDAAPKAHH